MTGHTQPTNGASKPADCSSIVVVASSPETRRRITGALAQQDLRASAQAEAPSEVERLAADASTVVVLVCDVDEPREMASLRRLCRDARQPAVVVISPPATGTAVRRALDAGADGLVFNPELERALAPTVRAVSIGQSVVPGKFRASVEKPVLSHRENQVLMLVRKGLTNAEIAKRLFLAESTIKSHLSSIFTKFGVRSRKEVAAAVIDFEPMAEATSSITSNGSAEERATA
jgi:DNA-binding NarL/FixJ family response regulator